MAGIRALAAVMFTDVVSFSAHVGRDEEAALRQIEEDFALMRQLCAEHEGQVLKSMGDGMLLVFMSAQNATHCAIDIQRRFGQRAWQGAVDPLLHRIGIHLCDIVLTENDAHGDGVNVAARLEREAPPGGIAMSQATYDLVRGKLPVKANFVGERYLRNIVEPVRIWEIPPVFAATPDLHEEARLPRAELRDKVEGQATSWGTIGALVFVGLAVLIAAFAVWFKGNPSSAQANEPKIVQEPGTLDPMNPTPVRTDPPKNEVPVTDPRVTPEKPTDTNVQVPDEETPEQILASDVRDARAAYDQAKMQFKATYDFEGMLGWVDDQAWSGSPAGKRVMAHWTRLRDLRAIVEGGMATHPPTKPLEISLPEAYKVWQIEAGKYGFLGPGDRQGSVEFGNLEPLWFKAIATSLTQDAARPGIRLMMNAFSREYGV